MNKHSRSLTGRHASKITEAEYKTLIEYLTGDLDLKGRLWIEPALKSHILRTEGVHDLVALNRALNQAFKLT